MFTAHSRLKKIKSLDPCVCLHFCGINKVHLEGKGHYKGLPVFLDHIIINQQVYQYTTGLIITHLYKRHTFWP